MGNVCTLLYLLTYMYDTSKLSRIIQRILISKSIDYLGYKKIIEFFIDHCDYSSFIKTSYSIWRELPLQPPIPAHHRVPQLSAILVHFYMTATLNFPEIPRSYLVKCNVFGHKF